jgi:hypothetical protein
MMYLVRGHSIGISASYYRATENELLEDYLKAIDALTIGNDNMLERQFSNLEEKRSQELAEFNLKIFEKSREIELLQLGLDEHDILKVAERRHNN